VERERGGKIGLDAPFEYFRYKRQPRFDHAALLKWFESTRVSAGAGGRGPLRYRDSPAKKSAYFLVNGRALTGADAGLSTGHSPTALLQALYTTKSVNWLRGRRSIRSLRAGLPATRLRAESSQQRRSKSPQYKRAPSALPPGYRSRLPAGPTRLRFIRRLFGPIHQRRRLHRRLFEFADHGYQFVSLPAALFLA
jgi:hypothetical protein